MPAHAILRAKAARTGVDDLRPGTSRVGPQTIALARVAAGLNGGGAVAALNDVSATLSSPTALSDAPLQLKSEDGVVQRSVLHLQNEKGEFVYYSDLEVVPKGGRLTTFKTREEAEKFDRQLASDSSILSSAIVTSQNRDRRVPTPFSYQKAKPQAKVRHQDQGPHSLSFISLEQRVQNRLRKKQHGELEEQVLTPEQAGQKMIQEYDLDLKDPIYQRYMLDYHSLYDEFKYRLAHDTDHGIGSAFHLVTRKILQLNPYTSYNGPKSTNRGEDRHGRLGKNTLDSKAKFKNRKDYEHYLQGRGDLYHSSDEEEDGHKPKDNDEYEFQDIPKRQRKYSRKRKAEEIEGVGEKKGERPTKKFEEEGAVEQTNRSSSSVSPFTLSLTDEERNTNVEEDERDEGHSSLHREDDEVEEDERDRGGDSVDYDGHRFRPQTEGIRDGGECFWDTMRRYGFKDEALRAAAQTAGVTVDQHVDARDITRLLQALSEQTGKPVSIRLVTFDLLTLEQQGAVTIGEGGSPLYVALFMQGEDGHYVPES